MYYFNVLKDYTLGYVEVKCAYSHCKRTIKVSRNKINDGPYCCGMGCAFETYNESKQQREDSIGSISITSSISNDSSISNISGISGTI